MTVAPDQPEVLDRPDLSTLPDAMLLRLIATALVELSKQRDLPSPIYPHTVQQAYNHLVLSCLRRAVPPPASVPDMVRWAEAKPIGQWPLDLPEEAERADTLLVDPVLGVPTQRCYEWRVTAPDPAAELLENQVIHEVFLASRAANAPETYTAFRRQVARRPVITGVERARLLGEEPALGPVVETVNSCYQPAPAAFRGPDGRFATCARCRCLLKPDGQRWRCELDRCRREGHARIGRWIDAATTNGVFQLAAPLRMFVTGPGLAEIELEDSLAAEGLRAEMWPGFDAYDLRITLPSQQVWAIDVKDRANPALLGSVTTAFRPEPRFDEAFLVVPAYRFDDREDYARVFAHYCRPEVRHQVALMSDTQFLAHVRAAMRRAKANTVTAGGGDA